MQRHLPPRALRRPGGRRAAWERRHLPRRRLPGAVCGDGIVTAPEECDDGSNDGSRGCDSSCRFVCVSTDSARDCSSADDGKRGGEEQCDDGNLTNLDGCDSHCKFEEAQRANSVTLLFGTDGYCTRNALGGAVGSEAKSAVQSEIEAAASNGSMNVMFAVLGLAGPTGQNGALALGAVTGTPWSAPPLAKYNSNKDLDWVVHGQRRRPERGAGADLAALGQHHDDVAQHQHARPGEARLRARRRAVRIGRIELQGAGVDRSLERAGGQHPRADAGPRAERTARLEPPDLARGGAGGGVAASRRERAATRVKARATPCSN